ncbi:MAG: NAD+ synthase [Phycisphaerales bacterium]|nr:NAD+ synthase [Phycisphaerales bacterium]
MRIGLIQFDPVVGDLSGNVTRLARMINDAPAADLYVTGELSLIGYPPRDLLQREGLGEACVAAASHLASLVGDRAVLVGFPRPVQGSSRPLTNAVALLRGGVIEAHYDKRLLPAYDVFDEERHFAPGNESLVIDVAGCKVGVLVCEDLWRAVETGLADRYQADPAADSVAAGATVLAVLTASPFGKGKPSKHRDILRGSAQRFGCSIISVNQCGANDDLVFDGTCAVVNRDGSFALCMPRWKEGVATVEVAATPTAEATNAVKSSLDSAADHGMADLFAALRCGIEGYFRKTNHQRALIGLSGGVDSAVVAALACRAIGAEHVRGVCMPSVYSSPGSIVDAQALASALEMPPPDMLPIADLHRAHGESLGKLVPIQGLADENLQSRIRGLSLLTLSNATGALVLTTGNKSEFATGYCTLGGDMLGGIAPIGDLLKTEVYELANYMNNEWRSCGFSRPPIPASSITKAPSAELRPNQLDQDSLPPYEMLDRIVSAWIEGERDARRIAASHSLDLPLVEKWTAAIERAEYKRLQSPLILKVSGRAFGRGRRMPIACKWRPLLEG